MGQCTITQIKLIKSITANANVLSMTEKITTQWKTRVLCVCVHRSVHLDCEMCIILCKRIFIRLRNEPERNHDSKHWISDTSQKLAMVKWFETDDRDCVKSELSKNWLGCMMDVSSTIDHRSPFIAFNFKYSAIRASLGKKEKKSRYSFELMISWLNHRWIGCISDSFH